MNREREIKDREETPGKNTVKIIMKKNKKNN